MKALILENNIVAQVVPDNETFEVVPSWKWVDCPDECEPSTWTYDGEAFAPLPPPPPPPLEEVLKSYDIAVELYLDTKAKAAGYYDPLDRIPAIDRACAYAGFPNPFQEESQMFVRKRSEVWAYVYGELAKVQSGERQLPTKEELVAELDSQVWEKP